MKYRTIRLWVGFWVVGVARWFWRRRWDRMALWLVRWGLRLDPGSGLGWRLLGYLLLEHEQPAQAVTVLRRALAIEGADPELLNGLGLALSRMFDFDAGCDHFRQAWVLAPQNGEIGFNLATALKDGGRYAEALAVVEAAVADHPEDAVFLGLYGELLGKWGRIVEAESVWQRVLAIIPDQAAALYNVSRLKRFTPQDPQIAQMERLQKKPHLGDEEAYLLAFALGQAYQDLGEHARSFELFKQANRLRRVGLIYDRLATTAYFDQLLTVFNSAFMAVNQGVGADSTLPVFIVGMPRSGTTLIEQILATHPQVHGGGERYDLIQLIHALDRFSHIGQKYPAVVVELQADEWLSLGQDYLTKLRALAPMARRITNKMPHHFFHVGFISLLLPQAKIIHCHRGPMDTCLSCYQTFFSARHEYAYDLADLGHYYRLYDRLMDHWQQALPGRILNVCYEKVIANPREQIQRLLDYCQLPWYEA